MGHVLPTKLGPNVTMLSKAPCYLPIPRCWQRRAGQESWMLSSAPNPNCIVLNRISSRSFALKCQHSIETRRSSLDLEQLLRIAGSPFHHNTLGGIDLQVPAGAVPPNTNRTHPSSTGSSESLHDGSSCSMTPSASSVDLFKRAAILRSC